MFQSNHLQVLKLKIKVTYLVGWGGVCNFRVLLYLTSLAFDPIFDHSLIQKICINTK